MTGRGARLWKRRVRGRWGESRWLRRVLGCAGGGDGRLFGQAPRGACAPRLLVVVAGAGRWCQADAGSVLSFLKAAASSCAQGQVAGSRRVGVRAWNARRRRCAAVGSAAVFGSILASSPTSSSRWVQRSGRARGARSATTPGCAQRPGTAGCAGRCLCRCGSRSSTRGAAAVIALKLSDRAGLGR